MKKFISCLMVTLPSLQRFNLFKASITSYQLQKHPQRELLILMNGGEDAWSSFFEEHVDSLKDPSIQIQKLDGSLSLGTLRNLSFKLAQGEIVCQWDDDDLYHPDRLTEQLNTLLSSGCEVVFLGEVIQLFSEQGIAYVTNWAKTETKGFPGSMMCYKSLGLDYPEVGPESKLGEDTFAIRQILSKVKISTVSGKAYLYIYRTHGANSWPHEHHKNLIQNLAISRGLILRQKEKIIHELASFGQCNEPINFHGSNGDAFIFNPPF